MLHKELTLVRLIAFAVIIVIVGLLVTSPGVSKADKQSLSWQISRNSNNKSVLNFSLERLASASLSASPHLTSISQTQDAQGYEPQVLLYALPGDANVYMSWETNFTVPSTAIWTITYDGPPGAPESSITDIVAPTRIFQLTNMTNFQPYTVTLSTMLSEPTVWLSDTVQVMPSPSNKVLKSQARSAQISLNWDAMPSLPPGSIWQIDYYTNTAASHSTITTLASSYTLTDGIVNDQWYTIDLTTVGLRYPLTDSVRVMPTNTPNDEPLVLHASPGDAMIYMSWDVNVTVPPTATWTITYDGPSGAPESPIVNMVGAARTFQLTNVTNFQPYTVTLSAMLSEPTAWLSDTVQVMPSPSDKVLKSQASDAQIFLSWETMPPLPSNTIWQIDYYTNTVASHSSVTTTLDTRAYTLTDGIVNDQWYTIDLTTIGFQYPLTDSVRVMPMRKFSLVFLPLIAQREHSETHRLHR